MRSAARFAGLVAKGWIGAAREQPLGDLRVVAFGGDHQRRAPAVVPVIDVGTGIDEIGDDVQRLRLCDGLVGPRRPHQKRELVAVTCIDIDTLRQQLPDNIEVAARGGIDDRRFAGIVRCPPVGAVRQQHPDDLVPAGEGGGGQRRSAASSLETGVGALVDQALHHGGLAAFGGNVERTCAGKIARVDRRASLQQQIDHLEMAGSRRAAQRPGAQPIPCIHRGALVQ